MDWKGKRVLITGADGFIGSHLVSELLKTEAESIHALVYYNAFNRRGWLEGMDLPERVSVTAGDIRDLAFIQNLFSGVDVVFHLAALIGIPYSYHAPRSYLDTNTGGTLNVCRGAMEKGCRRVIHVSTSEVYGSARYVPIDEAHPLQPQSPYSASKVGADAMAMSLYHSFDLPLVVARPFNTYGPRQSLRAVIPTIITQALGRGGKIHLGSLRPTRDFNYVTDTCRGLIMLAQCDGALGQTVNIGSGREVSIGDLVQIILKLTGRKIPVESDHQRIRPSGSEVDRLCCDNRKIRDLCGFEPQVSLEEGLEKTVKWFRESPESRGMGDSGLYHM